MDPHTIHDDREYQAALGEIERLWNAPAGSPKAQRLETWGVLIDQYEASATRPLRADPVEMIKADMNMTGRGRADFARIVGQNRASEILARKRPLTLDMIRAISGAWDIPADLLIARYETADRRGAGVTAHA
ncbi:MAG: helix-turn-helix domain-containing protein [Caulobacteraceae bacterium]